MRLLMIAASVIVIGVGGCAGHDGQAAEAIAEETAGPEDAGALPAVAQTTGNTIEPLSDAAFVEKAANAGMFTVESSRVAFARATKPELKAFAQTMIDDHTKANNELKSLVDEDRVDDAGTFPEEMDSDHQAKMAELRAATNGPDFDAKYRALQLESHREAVALFERQAASGQDATLKNWASQALSTLKAHLSAIESLAKQP